MLTINNFRYTIFTRSLNITPWDVPKTWAGRFVYIVAVTIKVISLWWLWFRLGSWDNRSCFLLNNCSLPHASYLLYRYLITHCSSISHAQSQNHYLSGNFLLNSPPSLLMVASVKIPWKWSRIWNVYFQTLSSSWPCVIVPAVCPVWPISGQESPHVLTADQSRAFTGQARTKLRFRGGNYPLSLWLMTGIREPASG